MGSHRCGNCKRISPIWSEFADLVSSAPEAWGQLRVACVKATDERNNPGTKHVKGFPTILYLLHGEVSLEASPPYWLKSIVSERK